MDWEETTREEFYAKLNAPLYRQGRSRRVTQAMVDEEMAIFRKGKAATGG